MVVTAVRESSQSIRLGRHYRYLWQGKISCEWALVYIYMGEDTKRAMNRTWPSRSRRIASRLIATRSIANRRMARRDAGQVDVWQVETHGKLPYGK